MKDLPPKISSSIKPSAIRIGNGQQSGQPAPPVESSVITVVRDPNHTLGKTFTLGPDGAISKKSTVSVSIGIAVMHHINSCDELAALLTDVGNNSHAAIINASFNGLAIGEEFLILSGREIEKQTGISRSDREKQTGIHEITFNGKSYKAVGRFKENVRPSCWQYADRDVDQHTPENFRTQTFKEWLSSLGEIVPGLVDVSHCLVGSTSSRVQNDGKSVGGGNGHLWFKVSNPEDIERFRTAIVIAATQADMTWPKPRYSRKEPDIIVGHSLTTIIDPSVFTPGRLTFIGKPVVGNGLTVEPLSVAIINGKQDSVDTSLVALPDKQTIRETTRKAGVAMEVSQDEKGLRITAHDLTLDTELETEDQGLLTLREIVKNGIQGKIRCQTPFRDSSSFAAFVSTGQDGKPFVHDVGTGITHWLGEDETGAFKIANAYGTIKRLFEKVTDDCGAPLEPEFVEALAEIKKHNRADFVRIRSDLKKKNKDVTLADLDKGIKAVSTDVAETHHGYATSIIHKLTVDGWPPKAHEGSLYVKSPDNLWRRYPTESIQKKVALLHDGKPNCQKSSDYKGIAEHTIMFAHDDDFFAGAPVGLATPDGFYKVQGDEIVVEPLSPDHRQRVKIDVTPKEGETPLFDNFLHETFQSDVLGEEEQQLTLVQEIFGAIMLGLMARLQKVALFFDPFGRAGKGTLERILCQLVPSDFVTAVSPFRWGSEYYLASLIGSRFNSVGELPESKPMPAAEFKTVTGGDLLTGRHPNHRPVTFKNEAAHLFMSNHLISTQDHSEAFFTRWLIIEFPNSRLRSRLPLDPGLADRIIQQELPGIAYWALLGAKRLMANGSFSESKAHDRLMEKWRHSSNSLEEFIHECCELVGQDEYIRRSDFYSAYKDWCNENGRRPFSKANVLELIAHNIGLTITHTKLNGNEIFRGIKLQDGFSSYSAQLASRLGV